jgi:hypothetical protein
MYPPCCRLHSNAAEAKQLQEALLAQAEGAITAAVDMFTANMAVHGGSAAAASQQGGQLTGLLQLRAQAQQVREQLDKVDDSQAVLAEVMRAVYAAEKRNTGQGRFEDFMRGHAYRCTNGHLYVIGECGGAMQRSWCAECGAPIGGERHHLDSSNRRAGDVLEQLG